MKRETADGEWKRDLIGFAFGVKLFYNPLCLEKTKEPERPYKRRKWQTEAQAGRKAKKWTKRWGYVMRPCMYQTPLGIFAHPALKPLVEQAIAQQHTIRQYTDRNYGRASGIISGAVA